MGVLRTPLQVKLFVSLLTAEEALVPACLDALSLLYGPVDHLTDPAPWTATDYYQDEMGAGLSRYFAFFERTADPGVLPALKHAALLLEERFSITVSSRRCRRINLDPGYLTEAKVVLSSTKDYSHRVYIGDGLYAETTLQYRGGRYRPSGITYPDYREDGTIELFMHMRKMLRQKLKERPGHGAT